jgi:hypothetical protein
MNLFFARQILSPKMNFFSPDKFLYPKVTILSQKKTFVRNSMNFSAADSLARLCEEEEEDEEEEKREGGLIKGFYE